MSRNKPVSSRLKTITLNLGGFVGLMWLLELFNWLMPGGRLDRYGIHPRNMQWLPGIVIAPFLHGSWGHLMTNTVPLLIFGGVIALQSLGDFWLVTLIVMLVSGLGVWLVGPALSVTVGASGVVFGYFGFLLLRGFFERSLSSIAISLGIGAFYGGLIWGVLPSDPHVSWQGHLFGFLGGALAARLSGSAPRQANR